VAALNYILAPKEAAGDDSVRIVEWSVPDGTQVAKGAVVGLLETTKASFDIETQFAGYFFHLTKAGDQARVGAPIAVVSEQNVRPTSELTAAAEQATAPQSETQRFFTRKAVELMEQHNIPPSAFSGLSVVRHTDVEEYIRLQQTASPNRLAGRFFAGEELDQAADWDALLTSEEFATLDRFLTGLRKRLKAKFNRHVPLGSLLHDRWAVAREYGFGEGTSVYDECLIQGDVMLGKHCWVGPFTILDGNFAALRIGDYTSIGSGSHIYSHDTIDNAITEGTAPVHAASTTIGAACFIAPMSVIGPGSRIGDHSFVASGSYVQGEFPAYSYIAGNPATRVGRVEIRKGKVLLLKDE
jgi:acetyltransferase-like isoleucine patch superfamily enzyme